MIITESELDSVMKYCETHTRDYLNSEIHDREKQIRNLRADASRHEQQVNMINFCLILGKYQK